MTFDSLSRDELLNLVLMYKDEPEQFLSSPFPEVTTSRFMAAVAKAIEEWMLFGFQSGWMSSGEGYNGEYPDEGVPWEQSLGAEAYARWRGWTSVSKEPS